MHLHSNNNAARCEANDRTERKNLKIDNYSWTLQHLLLNNRLNNYTENQQREENSATPSTNRSKSTFTENSSQHQQDIHSFQVTMEHLPRQTVSWAIKQTPVNLKELKLYRVYSLTAMETNQKSITE